MKYLLSLLTIFVMLGLNGRIAKAQQVSVALGPPVARVALQPGKTAIIPYTLENMGDPAVITLKIRPFHQKNSLGSITIDDNFSDPIRFSYEVEGEMQSQETYFMKSSERKKVKLHVEVPVASQQKDYYYALLAEVQAPPEVEGATSVRIKTTTVSYVLLTVTESGEIDSSAKILSFVVKPSGSKGLLGRHIAMYDSNSKLDLTLQMENTGTNVVYPHGTIDLRGLLGGHASYPIQSQTILAGSQRKFSMTLPRFFLGSYKVAANLSLGEGAPLLFAQTSFVIFPFKTVGFSIVVGALIVFILRKKKQQRS